ncbi:hypothetical protein FSARC_9841 [Fusarium sarcochroum]|uniref:Uncharacterized protein n=1 Tax=Fusarium sarcochroum TaxID=1208366 RepID=A0A8H4TQ66_9HYPO|nr:hypothetical protein FSARC_9841 [Fusarium sarcochroum]
MRHLIIITFLALSILLVAGREIDDAQPNPSGYDAPSDVYHDLSPSKGAQDSRDDAWERGPLVERWRQWIRRQDETETADDDKKTTEKDAAKETTKEEEKTTEDKATTTEEKATSTKEEPTTTQEPESTTQQPTTTEETTTQEPTTVSSTEMSTSSETSSESSSTTSSTLTTTEPGASCFSTTVSTSIVCSVTTGGVTKSASCITNRMTSSTCSPGLLCTPHPDSGITVCMRSHNEIGTEGIVVASLFGACIAGCMAVLVGMCLADKRTQKKQANLQRVKTLRAAARNKSKPEDQHGLMAGGPSS